MRNDLGFVQQGGQGDMPSASNFCQSPLVGNLQKWSLWTSIGSACYFRNGMQAGFSLHRQAVQNQYGRFRPFWQKNSGKVSVNRKGFYLFTIYYKYKGYGGRRMAISRTTIRPLPTNRRSSKMYDATECCLSFLRGNLTTEYRRTYRTWGYV